MPPADAAWSALLEAYGYMWTDELDVELMRGIRAGYFNPEEVKKKAKEVHYRIIATKADGSFSPPGVVITTRLATMKTKCWTNYSRPS